MSDSESAHSDLLLVWAGEAERRWEERSDGRSTGIPSEQVFAEAGTVLGIPTPASEE